MTANRDRTRRPWRKFHSRWRWNSPRAPMWLGWTFTIRLLLLGAIVYYALVGVLR